jgi:hypothetical protein
MQLADLQLQRVVEHMASSRRREVNELDEYSQEHQHRNVSENRKQTRRREGTGGGNLGGSQ